MRRLAGDISPESPDSHVIQGNDDDGDRRRDDDGEGSALMFALDTASASRSRRLRTDSTTLVKKNEILRVAS